MPQPRRLETVQIADAGVFVMLDRPNEFDGVVKSFVEEVR